jgi:hypothetical protein
LETDDSHGDRDPPDDARRRFHSDVQDFVMAQRIGEGKNSERDERARVEAETPSAKSHPELFVRGFQPT